MGAQNRALRSGLDMAKHLRSSEPSKSPTSLQLWVDRQELKAIHAILSPSHEGHLSRPSTLWKSRDENWWAASCSACWYWWLRSWARPLDCCWSIPPIFPKSKSLEHYRPSSITELYDGQGRIIGSFALQRRVVASYNDFPQVLRDALISIEDKDFYRHWGINVWRIATPAENRCMTPRLAAAGQTIR